MFIVDDMGGVKPGGYLKHLLVLFLCTTLVCLAASGGFFTLFDRLSRENTELVSRTAALEGRVAALTREKETLMARLVISGHDPDTAADKSDRASADAGPGAGEKTDRNNREPSHNQAQRLQDTKDIPDPTSDTEIKTDAETKTDTNAGEPRQEAPRIPIVAEDAGKVDIEDFSVTGNRDQDGLLVRFDVRNVSEKPGEVSGRIFTILKPQNHIKDKRADQWLVVPRSPLDNGIPASTGNGQYFSIAHFKPVKFRVRRLPDNTFFTFASVYIFNEQGELMLHRDFDIGADHTQDD